REKKRKRKNVKKEPPAAQLESDFSAHLYKSSFHDALGPPSPRRSGLVFPSLNVGEPSVSRFYASQDVKLAHLLQCFSCVSASSFFSFWIALVTSDLNIG